MTIGGRGVAGDLVVLVVLVKEFGEQCRLLLFTWIDQVNRGPHLGGVQLDHVVAETLHGGDDLALKKQKTNDVRGAAIELGTHVLRGRTALDDDFAFGHRRTARLPRGHLGRLELFDVATSTSRGLSLRSPRSPGAATRRCAATGRRRCVAVDPPVRAPPKPVDEPGRDGAPVRGAFVEGRALMGRDPPAPGARLGAPGAMGRRAPGGGGMGRPMALMRAPGRRRNGTTRGTERRTVRRAAFAFATRAALRGTDRRGTIG